MGFKDLDIFNIVMLAKQLWRLITGPHPLVVMVLKEKYFKHGNMKYASNVMHHSCGRLS